MNYKLEAKVELGLIHKHGSDKSKHDYTNVNLILGNSLDKKAYFTSEELPNKAGTKVLSNVLIQGLVANIHQAHENNYIDSATHLRWIISELERGFVTVANVSKSEF